MIVIFSLAGLLKIGNREREDFTTNHHEQRRKKRVIPRTSHRETGDCRTTLAETQEFVGKPQELSQKRRGAKNAEL